MDPSQSNSMPMGLLSVTEDSSPCTRHLSSLACLTSVCSDRLYSWSFWCQHCSLASSSPFLLLQKWSLSHSVDSSALSYTVRSPVAFSWFIGVEFTEHKFWRGFACAQIWNIRIRSFNLNLRYMATRKQTYIHTCLAMQSR